MLKLADQAQIHIALEPIDMRKSINGLTVAVVDRLSMDPQSQHAFVFRNKQKDKVKLLLWDRNGFVLYYKRLEKGRFQFPKGIQEGQQTISHEQLKWLLAGLDFITMGQFPELEHSAQFY